MARIPTPVLPTNVGSAAATTTRPYMSPPAGTLPIKMNKAGYQLPTQSKFGWQTGYGAFSVSKSNVDEVFGYIADQEEHHRKKTFQEEFLEYRKKHEIEYDERYIWESNKVLSSLRDWHWIGLCPTAGDVGYEFLAPAGARISGDRRWTSMSFDVCVIGSGPAGGVLSKELAEAGAKVALVEAGRVMKFEEFQYHAWPYELPFRGRRRPGTPPPAYPKEVRESIRYEDCDNISVDRIRAVGGRSIHWNAVCLRFAERDFREHSLEGIEEDWPLTYQELAPDYSHVEKMIGVTGSGRIWRSFRTGNSCRR